MSQSLIDRAWETIVKGGWGYLSALAMSSETKTALWKELVSTQLEVGKEPDSFRAWGFHVITDGEMPKGAMGARLYQFER